MPHPRVPEYGSSENGSTTFATTDMALNQSVAAAPPTTAHYVSDAQAQVISDIDYKDLGRHYTNFVSPTPSVQLGPPPTQQQRYPPSSTDSNKPSSHGYTSSSNPSGSAASSVMGTANETTVTSAVSSPPPSFAQNTNAPHDIEKSIQAQDDSGYAPNNKVQNITEQPKCMSGKRLFILVAIVLVLAGGVVGVVLALTGGGDEEKSETIVLPQVPNALHGGVDSRFGFSISTNNEGTRMAVADLSSVHIYQHDGKNNWNKMGSQIEAPANTTAATGLFEDGTVLIRAPVIVKMSSNGRSVAVGWSSYEQNRGLVQVYRYDEQVNDWTAHGKPLLGSSGSYYGASLDLSENGSILAVGAPGNGGLVGIYTFNTGIWQDYGTQILETDIDGLTITSVALARDGRTLAFGGVAGTVERVARMFSFDVGSGDWLEMGQGLTSNQDGTAYLVDLSGDGTTVAISNYYYLASNPGENNDALDVRAYKWSEDESSWVQLGETLHAFSPGAKSGYFISLSDDGRTMVMGDPGRIGGSGGNTGHSHVYIFDGEEWFQLGPNILGEAAGDHFGYDVVVSGDGKRFAASAPYSRALGTEYPHGRVLVFEIPEV